MADEVKPQVDWDRLDGTEPDWPGKKPLLHVCNGCGKPRPVEVFEAVDDEIAHQHVLLVLCDECRTPTKKTSSDKPYDDREVTAKA